MSEPCELLPWDTEFFGFPIARLTASELTSQSWKDAEKWCGRHRVRCLYCFLKLDFRSTRIVEAAGGNLVDVRMVYERRGGGHGPSLMEGGKKVRVAADSDMPALERVAGSSHRGRFHLDPHFPREKADELYRVWIRKGRLEIKDHVLVAEDSGGVVRGYCACGRKTNPSGEMIGVIEIIGVEEAARGGGIGRDLLAAALAYFAENGIPIVQLTTQAHNIAAQRLYQRFGFLVTDCQLTYHKWFDELRKAGGDRG